MYHPKSPRRCLPRFGLGARCLGAGIWLLENFFKKVWEIGNKSLGIRVRYYVPPKIDRQGSTPPQCFMAGGSGLTGFTASDLRIIAPRGGGYLPQTNGSAVAVKRVPVLNLTGDNSTAFNMTLAQ